MRVNYVPPRCFQLAILMVATLSGALFSQSTVASGSIAGIVTDPNGSPAAEVNVSIRNENAGPRILVATTSTGLYTSGPIIPGDYTVHIEEKGFLAVDVRLGVLVGAVSSGNIRLQPEVSSRRPSTSAPNSLDASQSSVAGVITSTQLDTLPLNGRNFLDLAQLAPGVQITDAADIDPSKSGFFAVSIDGFPGRTTRTLLDGIDLSDERMGTSSQNIAPNAIREFQVAQSVLDLSSTMTSSGTVNAITRSGSNSFHGEGFYGFRDQRLGFAAFPGGRDSYFQRHQFGGNLGGSIIRDRLFFFVSAQRTKQDYRGIPALDYPFNGLNVSYGSPFRDNTLLGRLDWVGDKMRVFYRAAYDEDSDIGGTQSYSPFLAHDVAPSHGVGLDIYRGNVTHSVRLGYSRYSNHSGLSGVGGLNPYPSLFIRNTSLAIGPNSIGPQSTIQSHQQASDDGTKVWNSHILRFGASFTRIEIGGNSAFGSAGATVTEVPTFENQQAILGNPAAYAGALVAGDPVGALDNPINYPVASILISNGQGYFSEKSSFGFPRGGLADNRIQLYLGDSWKIKSNLTVNYGLHYLRDGGLTNSDLGSIPSVNGFGPALGNTVRQPNLNFSPELGVAWAPFQGGRTVFRAGAGLYYDSNLFATTLADRAARLQQGQYFAQQPVCGPGEYSVILPNGTALTSSDGLNIATQICGQPLSRAFNGVAVAKAIADLQATVQGASAVPGANGFSVGKTGVSLGLFSPHYESPRSLQINLGWDHQFGHNTSLSLNYVRNVGTHYLLAVDRNHVGDANNLNVSNAIGAINRTLAARAPSCGQVNASTSISGINCYLNQVRNASISDFAVNGLDSSGVFANANASFPGDNTSLGQGIFFEPIGDSRYRAIDVSLRSIIDHPVRRILSMNLQAAYAWSKFQSNVPTGGSSSTTNVAGVPNAVDWDNPNGYLGPSGLSRTHQLSFATALGLPHSFSMGLIAHLDSPLPITTFLPQLNGGGVPGEIFRSDATGDGTVGDIVPPSNIGSFGGGSYSNNVNALISGYNANYAGHPTPAGNALIRSGLITQTQLLELNAVMPTLASASPSASGFRWFKTVDVRLGWQHVIRDRFTVEPSVSFFNVFNFANFDSSSNSLSGILQGLPGYSLNGSSTVGCGTAACRSADRVGPGSGVFAQGSARQLEFGVRFMF